MEFRCGIAPHVTQPLLSDTVRCSKDEKKSLTIKLLKIPNKISIYIPFGDIFTEKEDE